MEMIMVYKYTYLFYIHILYVSEINIPIFTKIFHNFLITPSGTE